MQRALDTHDTVLRALLSHHYGYEVTTEGDSFTMAFHDPADAVQNQPCHVHVFLVLQWLQHASAVRLVVRHTALWFC